MTKIERRAISGNVETRMAENGERITTLRFPLNKFSHPIDGLFYEIFDPRAFDEDLKNPERICIVDINHLDQLVPLARWKGGSGSLQLRREGDEFIVGEFAMPKSRPDVAESMDRGDMDGTSIAFMSVDEDWTGTHNSLPIRRIARATLHRMTLTYEPYYPDSDANLRMCMRSAKPADGEMTAKDYQDLLSTYATKNGITSEHREQILMLLRARNPIRHV